MSYLGTDPRSQLEAEISAYKDRAEEWLRRIEQEIEKTFASRQLQQGTTPTRLGTSGLDGGIADCDPTVRLTRSGYSTD
jgi:hypothetical protein